MWGATHPGTRPENPDRDFNPRSPCGERLSVRPNEAQTPSISIHAPRVGSDTSGSELSVYWIISIHAPRVGSDQADVINWFIQMRISIHAPRVGSDNSTYELWPGATDFNPRSPCGERPSSTTTPIPSAPFQSTLPVWGATVVRLRRESRPCISIHAPRVGSDSSVVPKYHESNFNPRSPCGERRVGVGHLVRRRKNFNPRSPCGERLLRRC